MREERSRIISDVHHQVLFSFRRHRFALAHLATRRDLRYACSMRMGIYARGANERPRCDHFYTTCAFVQASSTSCFRSYRRRHSWMLMLHPPRTSRTDRSRSERAWVWKTD